MKLRKGHRYDTYTYTKSGYEKIIREAGLNNIEFYLPYPGYNLPRMMIPYNNLNVLLYAIRSLTPVGLKRKAAWLLSHSQSMLCLYRYFFFSFGIVVQK